MRLKDIKAGIERIENLEDDRDFLLRAYKVIDDRQQELNKAEREAPINGFVMSSSSISSLTVTGYSSGEVISMNDRLVRLLGAAIKNQIMTEVDRINAEISTMEIE